MAAKRGEKEKKGGREKEKRLEEESVSRVSIVYYIMSFF